MRRLSNIPHDPNFVQLLASLHHWQVNKENYGRCSLPCMHLSSHNRLILQSNQNCIKTLISAKTTHIFDNQNHINYMLQ